MKTIGVIMRLPRAHALVICLLAALVLAGAAAGEVSRDGLVGEWHFDGDAKDTSGNGNDGTIYGASFVEGKFGKALSFDGVDDYVGIIGTVSTFSFIQNTGIFAIEGYSKIDAYASLRQQTFVSNTGTTVEKGFWFGWENQDGTKRLRLILFKGVDSVPIIDSYSPINIITDNNWHYIVVTGDGTNVKFYVDGIENLGSGKLGTKSSRSSTRPLELGRYTYSPGGSIGYLEGKIDKVRIYNRALSADEIKANYEEYITLQTPKPTITKSSYSAPSLSNSGGGSWQYYKDVTVKENSGNTLTDYQMFVQLSSSNFPTSARSDGADVRFTDANGNELSYWIESWDYAGKKAKIWVKVPSIPASAVATIRMYYGNPNAIRSSNGDSTFEFFDDFESGTLNKWNEIFSGASVILDNGNNLLRLYSGDGLHKSVKKNIVQKDIRVDLRYKIIQNGNWDGARFGSSLRTKYAYILADWHFLDSGKPERYLGKGDGAITNLKEQQIPYYSTLGVWYNWGFSVVGSSSVELKGYGNDGEVLISYTDSIDTFPSGQLKLWIFDDQAIDYVDDVRVRKYTSPEPTLTLDAEQTSALGAPIETPIPALAQQITGPKSAVTATPESSNFYVYAGIGGIVILLSAMIVLRRNKKGRRDFYDNIDLAIQPEKNSYEVGETVSFIITVSNAAGDISAGSIESPLFKQIDVPKVKLGDKYREKLTVESIDVGTLIGTATAVIKDEKGNEHAVKKSFEVEITPPRPKLKIEMANEKLVKPLERSYIVLSISNAGKARAEDVSLNVQADSGVDIGEYSKPGAIDSNSMSKIKIPYVCISAGEFNVTVAASYRNGKQYQEHVSISIRTLSLKPQGRLALELPSSIKMGEQAFGHIIIGNAGEDAMLNVTTSIDGLSVTIPVFSRIEAKKEVKERFPVAFNSHGSKIIKVQIDYEDEIGKRYSVSEEKSIIVRGLQLKPAIVIEVPQALVQGETASGKINIRNDGEEIIKDASLTVLVNGTQVKAGTFGEIRPKKGTTIDIPIKIDSERADLVANLKYKDTLGNEYTYQERSSFSVRERAVFASSAVSYQGALILYKVKVENKLPKPISDVKIKAYVPDVFLIKENEKTIAMLEPNNARTVTFEIRPTGECGECNISGKINYYNNLNDKREDIDISVRAVSIICPLLKVREISEQEWRNLTGSLIKAEEKTNEIPISARSLFSMVSDIIKDMNLYMLNPNITDDNNFFRGVARFYGEGVKELKYAAQLEVIGGVKKSQLILKAFAEREDALTGFYYKVLDEIEKRMHVKEYIDNTIVQQYIHIGPKIGNNFEGDVVAVRSNIGAGTRKCLNCGREVDANETFCKDCGAKL